MIVNPFTYYVLHTTRTYFWVIPLTLVIWMSFQWSELNKDRALKTKPAGWEVVAGLALVIAVMARDLLQTPSERIFGIFDMLVVFVGLCIALFGYRSLQKFWVPGAFFAFIGFGYSIERALVDWLGYDVALAGLVAFLCRILGSEVTTQGPKLILPDRESARLLIDYGCTGIKGILAFGFISAVPIIESGRGIKDRTIWVLASFAGFYAASVLRLVAVVFAVIAWGQIAVDYHTTIGFGFFMAWLIFVVYYGSEPPVKDGI